MNKGKVLIAAPVHKALIDGLAAEGYTCVHQENITQQQAYEIVKDCTGIITSTRLQLDKEMIDAAPHLQWVGRMGSGMEIIDVPYATAKGIACYSSPEGNCNAVAEHALGMLLGLTKRIVWSNAEVKKGHWLREENRGIELEGMTAGIIGYGHTGSAFARKLQGMDVNVIAYDKYYQSAMQAPVRGCTDLFPLYEEADIVSFHVPLQADTVNYFNDKFVESIRKPFILINTSRGPVVNTAALLRGLHSGKIKGACLDVWEQEPLSKMNANSRKNFEEIVLMPQVIITPHIAGYSFEAVYKMSITLLSKIINV
ncbi:MAG: hydroxyacid dehydrogenase [Taibaiella sp.]|nr:hydroxyacid dehydrogenase [Taibaiella sp.]